MTQDQHDGVVSDVQIALASPDASARLQAALAAGAGPAPEQVEVLVQRCAVEPDFYVRDMLTWALTRHDTRATVARLVVELRSQDAQARSQALHTLSKIGDPSAWAAITPELLQDEDDEVARTAWRTAVALVPVDGAVGLAETLAGQLGRGNREMQRSLSRALIALGGPGSAVVDRASRHPDEGVRAHAGATTWLAQHPEEGFDAAVAEARRVVVLLGAPVVAGEADADR